MSKLAKKAIYFPQLLKTELQTYENGHLFWISGPNATIFRYSVTSPRIFGIPQDLGIEKKTYEAGASPVGSPWVTPNTTFVLKKAQLTIQKSSLNSAQEFYQLLKTRALQKNHKSLGLWHGQIQKSILSVLTGYKKYLTLRGVGYKFQNKNRVLILQIGYSHRIQILIPSDIQMKFNRKLTSIRFTNLNDTFLHGWLSSIKNAKKPDVYKGKGIRYKKETVLRKEGKKKKTF